MAETNTPNTQAHREKWKNLWKVLKPWLEVGPTSKTPPRFMRKNNKTINRKACVFPTIDPTIDFSNAQKKASLGNSLWFNSM